VQEVSAKRPNLKYNSIQVKFIVFLLLLSTSQLISSTFLLYNAWLNYLQAKEIEGINEIIFPLIDGMSDFMFERGRMNVVLATREPISADNRVFIDQRRKTIDLTMAKASERMQLKYPEEAVRLSKEYEKIKVLRNIVDEEASKPYQARELPIRTLWFKECTDFINNTIKSLVKFSRLEGNSATIANNYALIINNIRLRNIIGNESSLIISTIAEGKNFDRKDYDLLIALKGKSEQAWLAVESRVEISDSEEIKEAKEEVIEKYFKAYRPEQDRILNSILADQVNPNIAMEIAAKSVPALDAIYYFNNALKADIRVCIEEMLDQTYLKFIFGGAQFSIAVLLMLFVPFYFRLKLVVPLNEIIEMLEQLRIGKTETEIVINRKDEIGILANGVEMLRNSIIEEQRLKKEMEILAITDSLTGLLNRGAFFQRAQEEFIRCSREGRSFSLMLIDIDFFKHINDTYGHLVGDEVLKKVADCLAGQLRPYDLIGRYGGEEFVACFSGLDFKQAQEVAERVRTAIMDYIFVSDQQESISITISIGITTAEVSPEDNLDSFLSKADKALYQAKAEGKNRVVGA
jgi:diguanylate cyclase (GGDEF)-like protein